MNDLEICTRIAEIEDRLFNIESSPSGDYIHDLGDDIAYDPLTDKALCFDLMIKYDIRLSRNRSGEFAAMYTHCRGEDSKCPQRAICLAIIKKNDDRG